jgi:hypothetical protein
VGAGGWEDPKMPTKLYGHFAYSESGGGRQKPARYIEVRFNNDAELPCAFISTSATCNALAHGVGNHLA